MMLGSQAQRSNLVVNTTTDASDASHGDGLCETALGNGICTLRAAIQEANAYAGEDVIAFNIPGAGPHTSRPATLLPDITDPVVIDGVTQPGASPNTNAFGQPINAVLKIELSGLGLPFGLSTESILTLRTGSSTVRGLVINGLRGRHAIVIHPPHGNNNVIEGNFIGTDVTGMVSASSGRRGIALSGTGNLIGGRTPEARNLISVTGGDAISMSQTGNQILGNFIGTQADGASALGNTMPATSWVSAARRAAKRMRSCGPKRAECRISARWAAGAVKRTRSTTLVW